MFIYGEKRGINPSKIAGFGGFHLVPGGICCAKNPLWFCCCWCMFPFKMFFFPSSMVKIGPMATCSVPRTWKKSSVMDRRISLVQEGMRCSKKDNESSVHTQQRLPFETIKILNYHKGAYHGVLNPNLFLRVKQELIFTFHNTFKVLFIISLLDTYNYSGTKNSSYSLNSRTIMWS